MKFIKLQLAICASLLMLTGFAGQSAAEVNVSIGIFAPPPVYVAPAPPPVVVIPGTYVYAVSDPGVEILFYGGYWWRPYEGRWYRSSRYNGSWTYVRAERIPRAIVELPRDYHRHIPYGQRISHNEMKKNWKRWEKEKHWEREHEKRYSRDDYRDHRDVYRDHGDRDRDRERDRDRDRGEGHGRGKHDRD